MINKIKSKLMDNEDEIRNVLEEIGCTYIKQFNTNKGKSFKFGHDSESSGGANIINISDLHYHSFSNSTDGDILTLTSEMLNISLGDSIKWLAKFLGLKFEYTLKEVKLPFMGFWKDYDKIKKHDNLEQITYPPSRNYYKEYGVSLRWVKDNISLQTQEEFQVGYDLNTNRITYPWLDYKGDIIGIMGRLNKDDMTEKEYKYKYMPIIPFNKGKNLFGFYQNYKDILNTNTLIICESEKSVMQAHSYGIKNVVALGCKTITEYQEKLIKTLCCNVILALDEGVPFDYCKEQLLKCKIINPFFTTDLYVLDMNKETNENIKEDKVCIFDLNEDSIIDSFKNHLIKID